MPFQWQEKVVRASISGEFEFDVGVLAKPFSTAANAAIRLMSSEFGLQDDFARHPDPDNNGLYGAEVLS